MPRPSNVLVVLRQAMERYRTRLLDSEQVGYRFRETVATSAIGEAEVPLASWTSRRRCWSPPAACAGSR